MTMFCMFEFSFPPFYGIKIVVRYSRAFKDDRLAVEGSRDDHLVDVVVQGAEKLRPEKRLKAGLAERVFVCAGRHGWLVTLSAMGSSPPDATRNGAGFSTIEQSYFGRDKTAVLPVAQRRETVSAKRRGWLRKILKA